MATSLGVDVALSVQLVLGFAFGSASMAKIRDPKSFGRDVAGYDIFSPRVSSKLAIALIVAEFIVAIAFVSGWATVAALLISCVILTSFVFAIGINLKRERRIACGCFGDATEEISQRSLARLFLLLSLVLGLLITRITGGSVPSLWREVAAGASAMFLIEAVFGAVSLLIFGSWLLHMPELIVIARGGPRRKTESVDRLQ